MFLDLVSCFKMQTIIILILILFENYTKCDKKVPDKFVNPFPYFRLKMEEVYSDQVHESLDEPSDNFVSFLIDNVKQLFVPSDNSTMINTVPNETFDSASLLGSFQTSLDAVPSNILPENYSLITNNFYLPFLIKHVINNSKLNSSNETDWEILNLIKKIEWASKMLEEDSLLKLKRTCIACNNILNEDCGNPAFKLVPSIDCQREDDLCYSQHTPFGIIDRGCFNVNHDLTLFVCACNLCNYISISEMPYIFSNKRDWVQNVIELSRAKRFRESIFKDMSCLRCEVNVTAKKGNKFADLNCLEGNITALPRQTCTADEICGVKAIRSQGYVWRGCLTEPLYNYWWTFCENDSCNYDALVSIYDTEI